MLSSLRWFITLAVLLVADRGYAEVRYVARMPTLQVHGGWSELLDGSIVTIPDTAWIDLDVNGVPDVAFEHSRNQVVRDIPAEALGIIIAARNGLRDLHQEAMALAHVTLEVNTGAIDMRQGQNRAARHIDGMRQAINNTTWLGAPLLDGSHGLKVIADTPEIEWATAAPGALPGDYPITVTRAATRAEVLAAVQAERLGADETLTINGNNVSLDSGMDRSEIIRQINSFQKQIAAHASEIDGKLVIRSDRVGSASKVTIISDRAAHSDSSGFGTTSQSSLGESGQIDVAGMAIPWDSNVFTIPSGPGAGVRIKFASVENSIGPKVGVTRSVRVIDQSLQFPVPGFSAPVKMTLPDLRIDQLAIGSPTDETQSLVDLNLEFHPYDSYPVVAQAIREITNAIAHVGDIYWSITDIVSQTELLTGDQVRVAVDSAGKPLWLRAMDSVGPNLSYGDERVTVISQDEHSLPCVDRVGYLGLTTKLVDGDRYGWIRVTRHCDGTVALGDSAWESDAGKSLLIAPVPETTSGSWMASAMVLTALRRRMLV